MTPRARSGLALGAAIGAAAVAITAAGSMPGPAAAQAVQRAGLVVQLGAGDVRTFCVTFAEPSISGEALLRRSGLAVSAEIGVLGTLVCRIGDVGCDHPREACWCRCRTLGAGCTYWGYSTLDGDRWAYSPLGAQARVVRDGDVDGWAWGAGAIATGAMPPVMRFEDLCAAPATAAPGQPASTTGAATAPPVGTAPPLHPNPPVVAVAADDVATPTRAGPASSQFADNVAGEDTEAAAASSSAGRAAPAALDAGARTTAVAPPSDAPNTPSAPGRDRDVDDRRPGDTAASSRPGTGGEDGSVAAAARGAAADRAALAVYAGLVAALAAAAAWVRRRS